MQCATLMWGMQIEVSLLFENASLCLSASLALSFCLWQVLENA